MTYNQALELYHKYSDILEILSSGNIHDQRYKDYIKNLKVNQVEMMRLFVDQCNDLGFQYLHEKN